MRACEDCDDPEPEALSGSIIGADAGEVASLCLDLIAGTARLVTLVHELTPSEYRAVAHRLSGLRDLVRQVPKQAVLSEVAEASTIGFKPPVSTKTRGRRR